MGYQQSIRYSTRTLGALTLELLHNKKHLNDFSFHLRDGHANQAYGYIHPIHTGVPLVGITFERNYRRPSQQKLTFSCVLSDYDSLFQQVGDVAKKIHGDGLELIIERRLPTDTPSYQPGFSQRETTIF